MKQFFSIFMIFCALALLPACGDDGDTGGGRDCDDAVIEASAALQAWLDNQQDLPTCLALLDAANSVISACDEFLSQEDIDEWNDIVDQDPCN